MMRRAFKFVACLLLWGGILGLEHWSKMPTSFDWISRVQQAAKIEIQRRDNQWIVCLFFLAYFLAFLWLPVLRDRSKGRGGRETRRRLLKPILYTLFVLIAAAQYWRWYDAAFHQTRALVLISGLMLGGGVAFFRKSGFAETSSGAFTSLVLGSLLGFLALVSLWQPEQSLTFDYRDRGRWTGILDNPNRFGMLMGVGVVVAASRLMWSLLREPRAKFPEGWSPIWTLAHLVALGVTGFGLYQSFSRGAWLGTFLGLACLGALFSKRQPCAAVSDAGGGRVGLNPPWRTLVRRHFASVLVGGLASLVIFFWTFQHSEVRPVRRVLSVANMNDFSWRNRVAAYEGALQMMAERPVFGVGWGQSGERYGNFYAKPKIEDAGAIGLNDFFSTGVSLGIPALVMLVCLVWLSAGSPMEPHLWARGPDARDLIASRSALAVLLTGFWFDDGLFRLSTGAVFWVLLELSSGERSRTVAHTASVDSGGKEAGA